MRAILTRHKDREIGDQKIAKVAGRSRGTVKALIYRANINYGQSNLTVVTKRQEPRVEKNVHLGNCSQIGTIVIRHVCGGKRASRAFRIRKKSVQDRAKWNVQDREK